MVLKTNHRQVVDPAYVYIPQSKPVYNQKTSFNKTQKQNKPERICFYCDSKLHIIVKVCPHFDKKKDDGHVKTKQFTNSSQKKSARVHTVVIVSSATPSLSVNNIQNQLKMLQ